MAHVGGRAKLPYVAAFDGLRALAVLAVVAYHASLAEMPGGFFGVDVFFVISGYLVTALFLFRTTVSAADRRDIPQVRDTLDFWGRRLARLVPAAVVMVLVTWLAFALLSVRLPGVLTAEALTALGYTANWFFLFNDQSYFDTIATPSPFLHFWSLAVEAQFYLVWPVILIAALHFGGRLAAFAIAISLAAISTLVVASLYSPETDPSRAYYGTDARVAGLLLGAALAIVVRPSLAARVPRLPVEFAGWGGLAVLLWLTTSVSEYDPFIYHGGFFIASTAALAVLVASLHGANTVAWVLSRAPLRWLGKRAYSIYLWHWPIFVITQPQMATDLESTSLLVARLGATLILADFSYRFVESQFRGELSARRLPRIEFGAGPILQRPWARPAGVFSVGLIAIVAAGGLPVRAGIANDAAQLGAAQATAMEEGEYTTRFSGLLGPGLGIVGELAARQVIGATDPHGWLDEREAAVRANLLESVPPGFSAIVASVLGGPAPSTMTTAASRGRTSDSVDEPAPVLASNREVPSSIVVAVNQPSAAPVPGTTDAPPPIDLALSSAVASSGSVAGPRVERTEVSPASAPDPAALGASVTIVGDSVTLGAADALLRAMPGAVVDAEVGRQFWSTPAVIAGLAERGALGDVVVLHLGANGPFTSQQYEMIMDLLGERTVVWVTITVPRRWETDVNEGLATRTATHEGALMADWHTLSRGTEEFFVSDGVHLTAAGQHAYASLIAETVTAAIAVRR